MQGYKEVVGNSSIYDIVCFALIQGVPEKMSFSEKEAYLAKGHYFWDTW